MHVTGGDGSMTEGHGELVDLVDNIGLVLRPHKPTTLSQRVKDRASLYDEITSKIIAELEAGRVPWV